MIAGVDVSSRIIAIVLLDEHTGALRETLELRIGGKRGGDPTMPQSSAFRIAAETLALARTIVIENPMGGRALGVALCNRALGALIHALEPTPGTKIILWSPTEWKTKAGLHGHADKAAIRKVATALYPELAGASQDTCDAAMIARAGYHETSDAARLAENA